MCCECVCVCVAFCRRRRTVNTMADSPALTKYTHNEEKKHKILARWLISMATHQHAFVWCGFRRPAVQQSHVVIVRMAIAANCGKTTLKSVMA